MTSLEHLRPLIDGDPLVYACGFSADSQIKKEWLEQVPEDCPFDKAELEQDMANLDYEWMAIANTRKAVDTILEKFKGEPSIYLTGHGNFRDTRATIKPYKGNRDPTHKPKYYKAIKRYLCEVWSARLIEGEEADDAIAQEQWQNKDKSTIICSIDKDLLYGLPGWSYNYRKEEARYTSVLEANLFHFRQMLEGDTSDNIPGITGVGAKTIDKIWIRCNNDMDAIRAEVQKLYEKQYGEDWVQAYEEVSDLLWLRRVAGKGCPFLYA